MVIFQYLTCKVAKIWEVAYKFGYFNVAKKVEVVKCWLWPSSVWRQILTAHWPSILKKVLQVCDRHWPPIYFKLFSFLCSVFSALGHLQLIPTFCSFCPFSDYVPFISLSLHYWSHYWNDCRNSFNKTEISICTAIAIANAIAVDL